FDGVRITNIVYSLSGASFYLTFERKIENVRASTLKIFDQSIRLYSHLNIDTIDCIHLSDLSKSSLAALYSVRLCCYFRQVSFISTFLFTHFGTSSLEQNLPRWYVSDC